MVFIVKLPARGTSSARGTPGPQEGDTSTPTPQIDTNPAAFAAQPIEPLQDAPDTTDAPAAPATPALEGSRRPNTATLDVLLAPSVLKHRYVRGMDHSAIVERPERIRAVLLGVAGALGAQHDGHTTSGAADDALDLASKLSALSVDDGHLALRVVHSTRALSLDDPSDALRRIHALASEPATYSTLSEYAFAHPRGGAPSSASHASVLSYLAQNAPSAPPGAKRPAPKPQSVSDASSSDGEGDERMHASEIPAELPQGDLYLCGPHADGLADTSDGGSREAICHALGACAEAVDRVVTGVRGALRAGAQVEPVRGTQHNALAADVYPVMHPSNDVPARRAFVLARPPGHHCTGSVPSGFCWVNNVAVAATHAHSVHGIDRVIVLDIDLHHGNGTQALAWRINAEANAADADRAARLSTAREPRSRRRATLEQLLADEQVAGPRALRMFYGSVHDIESYPCEDGDVEMIRNASVCLAGAHSQWIWNGTLPDRQGCLFTCKRAEGASRHPVTGEQISEAVQNRLTSASRDPQGRCRIQCYLCVKICAAARQSPALCAGDWRIRPAHHGYHFVRLRCLYTRIPGHAASWKARPPLILCALRNRCCTPRR